VFGIVTEENSANVPELHCTVTKDVEVAVRTHVCAIVWLADTHEMEKPLRKAVALDGTKLEHRTRVSPAIVSRGILTSGNKPRPSHPAA
jgi:hypothetical protein